jgi:hypothetical protein
VSTGEYNGRTASFRPAGGQTVEASAAQTDRLNLWLAAWQVLYAAEGADDIENWRHAGGDTDAGRVIDVLEYRPDEGRDLLIAIHPQSHWPTRVRYEPTDAPDAEHPQVELELGEYRAVGGSYLPHRFSFYVGGRITEIETVTSYGGEASP